MSDPEVSRRKPEWLKIRLNTTDNYHFLKKLMRAETLHTVCEEARCPNLQECWGTLRTASFMILGDTCTRRCRFCAVNTGLPGEVDTLEPLRVAGAVEHMKLKHVHVTMVNRDDLPDGGASIMAATVRALRWRAPDCSVEVLTSDFMGSEDAIRAVVESGPDIISHNVETVRRLTPRVRSRSSYERSLEFLRVSRRLAPDMVTKSSIMLGLGETSEEVEETLTDLRSCGVDVVNIGQYLQPTRNHIPGAPLLDAHGVRRGSRASPWRKASSIARPGLLSAPPITPMSSSRDSSSTLPKLRAAKAAARQPASS